MDHLEVEFLFEGPDQDKKDILAAFLGEKGFTGFHETDEGLLAYVPVHIMDKDSLTEMLGKEVLLPAGTRWTTSRIKEKNWNEEWERNFQPVSVDDQCLVRAPFHRVKQRYRYEVVLVPKMSFGTGHHSSTRLMIKAMLAMEHLTGSVLDMGCGTAILAILASLMGARHVIAADINRWAVENARENIRLNNLSGIDVMEGEIEALDPKEKFDLILANINFEVIIGDMGTYQKMLKEAGKMILGGFLSAQAGEVMNRAASLHLKVENSWSENEWSCIVLSR